MITLNSRRIRFAGAVLGVMAVAAATGVAAKPGGGFSSGSRGSRTFSAPPSTPTAPQAAQPMQRTQTTPQASPRPANAPMAPQSRFGGLGAGLMGGLLGAGLFGMLMGGGFMGGLGGLASMFGLLMQVALIGGLIWLAVRFFRRRQEPAFAGAGAPYARQSVDDQPRYAGGGGGASAPRGQPQRSDEIGIGQGDYAAFDRTLNEIQDAYSREDVAALRRLATPEMAGFFEGDLADNARQGVVNRISGVKLLQGDLAEAWREGPVDYATVAMRFALVDAMVERKTGRVVSGDLNQATEAAELWTFRRERGGAWILSAIQRTQ